MTKSDHVVSKSLDLVCEGIRKSLGKQAREKNTLCRTNSLDDFVGPQKARMPIGMETGAQLVTELQPIEAAFWQRTCHHFPASPPPTHILRLLEDVIKCDVWKRICQGSPGSQFLLGVPEGLTYRPMKQKPKLSWRPQDVKDAKAVRSLLNKGRHSVPA